MRGVLLAIVFFFFCEVGVASAQNAEVPIEALERMARPRPERLSIPAVQFTSQRAPANASEIRLVLSDLRVVGATVYDEADLSRFYAEKLGTEISLSEVFEIAQAIQSFYRSEDYIFTRVVVPAQEIINGTVNIEVIEAEIVKVVVEQPGEPVGRVETLVAGFVEPLMGVKNPTGRQLERAIILVNEIPGMIRATVVPQVDPSGRGALALFVNVERDPLSGVIYGDTRQAPSLGRGLAGVSGAYNSYTYDGDTTTLGYYNSFGYESVLDSFDERHTFEINHSRYIGSSGLQWSGRFFYSNSSPGSDLGAIGISSDQYIGTSTYTYPIIRSRRISLSGAIGGELNNTKTKVANGAFVVADDKLRTASFGLDGFLRDEYGYFNFDVELRKGLDIFDASDSNDILSRADGQVDYTLVRGSMERLFYVDEDLSIFLSAAGQYAFDPLLASEEFEIGGITYGRGFDPSEFTGDHGIGLTAEIRYALPMLVSDIAFDTELYAFGDYAAVFNRGQGQPDNADILSSGFGSRFFFPQDYFLGLELAVPIDQPLQRNASKDIRFFLNFSKRL